MILRAATAADASAIAAIWNPVIADSEMTFATRGKTVEGLRCDIAEKHSAGQAFLVAEMQGRIAGFATYSPFRASSGYDRTMEHTIYLAAACRGRGVGRALLQALETHARQAGVHSLIAAISGANLPAMRFHAAQGYAKVGEIAQAGHKFNRWFGLILMQKLL